ncbi:TDP-N-acetylfucosamine:lipid II N-acetylfucosaminyltransferase [Teredinibacter turnerae]|uniref:TDP-N-acetylfucosamine:lipid II N-acetylfucosaminyltransferase n=1 Tax=Teredinibacter turnerae TaxID=2426 RepID=UPI00039E5B97|nr:TDP-N-acetylfucosamine:lipid II N-acetylfucosaminyltransferase [Teredinibacter turnerae]
MKILHLATDDKFIDHGLRIFKESIPAPHDVIVCAYPPLKYVKLNVSVMTPMQIFRGLEKVAWTSYALIVLHSLNQNWFPLIKKIPDNIPVVWLGWGLDYYDILYRRESSLYKDLTFKYWKEKKVARLGGLRPKGMVSRVLKKVLYPSKASVLKRVDVFSPVLPSEYELVKKSCGHLKADYLSWNYGNLEENLIKGFESEVVKGSAILVGNSAGFTNNHLDSFNILKKIDLNRRKIICPLSYGDPGYASYIIASGRAQFGDNFVPLVDFMAMNDYVATLCDCGYVIMDHLRQQAVGNIVIMLYLGAKVFLNDSCPTFAFLKMLGVSVHSIQELSERTGLLDKPLSEVERLANRSAVLQYWGKAAIEQKTKVLVATAIKNKTGKTIEL